MPIVLAPKGVFKIAESTTLFAAFLAVSFCFEAAVDLAEATGMSPFFTESACACMLFCLSSACDGLKK